VGDRVHEVAPEALRLRAIVALRGDIAADSEHEVTFVGAIGASDTSIGNSEPS